LFLILVIASVHLWMCSKCYVSRLYYFWCEAAWLHFLRRGQPRPRWLSVDCTRMLWCEPNYAAHTEVSVGKSRQWQIVWQRSDAYITLHHAWALCLFETT